MQWTHVKDKAPDTWAAPFTRLLVAKENKIVSLAVLRETERQKMAREALQICYGEAGMEYHVNGKANDFVYWMVSPPF